MRFEDISVVIPIKEDISNLTELLNNLSYFGFNDIHIIDSIFSNSSQKLAQSFRAKYIHFEWNGIFPKKRNWYLDKGILRNWVLFLDSDERLNEAFVNELKALNTGEFKAVKVRYNNTFMDTQLKFGDTMTKIPLIRNTVRFEKIDEDNWSKFDMEIHEHPVVNKGEYIIMNNRIDHLERSSITKYIEKHNNYSSWEANRLKSLKHKVPTSMVRQSIKYRLIGRSYGGILYFLYSYFFRLGFIDGKAGLRISVLKAFYFYSIYLKVLEDE